MNYFTPDLLARFGSADDAVADAASEEWERASERYHEHLAALRPRLPRSVKQLLKVFCLHDAKVLTLTFDDKPYFSLFLEIKNPGKPRDRFLELRYHVTRRPVIQRHQFEREDGAPLRWWLYDEIDVPDKERYEFTHSILFTGGYELQLSFTGLRLSRPQWTFFPHSVTDSERVGQEVGELLEL